MALVPQSPFFSSLSPTKTPSLSFRNFRISSSLSTSNPQPSPQEQPQNDAIKLALAKAKAYKKGLKSNPTPQILDTDEIDEKNNGLGSEDGDDEVVAVGNDVKEGTREASGVEKGNSENSLSALLKKGPDANVESRGNELKSDNKENGDREVPLAVKLALEKAKKYKENKGVLDSNEPVEGSEETSGITSLIRDGVDPASTLPKSKAKKKEQFRVSGIDFVGLGFADKKTGRGLPAGLVPVIDSFPEGDFPEVEMVVGDMSKFGDGGETMVQPSEEDNLDVYKPKVSTWGVFPRPSDISKTYGGGRTIRPGEVLETAEDKAAKQARTRQLIAAYNKKVGLNIDPKLKSECEKALTDGDSMMDLGNLKEALPFYELVMDKLPFQTKLYGLAAIQWSICQDSLSRRNEARAMYEKLQSHPNPQVGKKARQFMFGFQAMEMLKVSSSTQSTRVNYQNYFEAFVRDKENYSVKESEVEEGTLSEAIPYILFLVSPILIVLIIAVQKGSIN